MRSAALGRCGFNGADPVSNFCFFLMLSVDDFKLVHKFFSTFTFFFFLLVLAVDLNKSREQPV